MREAEATDNPSVMRPKRIECPECAGVKVCSKGSFHRVTEDGFKAGDEDTRRTGCSVLVSACAGTLSGLQRMK